LELALYHNGQVVKITSLPLGAVRLLEMFGKGNYGIREHVLRCLDEDSFFSSIEKKHISKLKIVGSGGNIRAISRLCRKKSAKASSKTSMIQVGNISKLLVDLEKLNFGERQKKYHLPKDRVDVIVPAAIVFHEILKKLCAKKIFVPNKLSLRQGLLLEYQKQLTRDHDRYPSDEFL
jgi:exopolyphosphatase/guanosine-5'-triphosphate,3'-diphosphate pyrophosphatase